MTELEQMLTRLGSELDWPQTPELAARVTRRLSEPERTRRRAPVLSGFRRSLAIALVLLLVVAAAAVAAVPSVRDAVLEFFGLQGATVERTTTLPTPPPDRPLDLGSRTSLGDAGAQLAFEPLVPSELGEPDAVYVRSGVPGGELSLAYRARPGLPRAGSTRLGLLLSEFRGDLQPEYLGKIAGQVPSRNACALTASERSGSRARPTSSSTAAPATPSSSASSGLLRTCCCSSEGRCSCASRAPSAASGLSRSPALFASRGRPRAGAAGSGTRSRQRRRPRRSRRRRRSRSCRGSP